MPVRIANDENLPVEYFDISMDNMNCYFSSADGGIYEEEAATENNGNIDIVFYVEEQEGGFVFVFFSPHLLNDENFMGEGNAMDWGVVNTEFRTVNISGDEFDELMDFNHFQELYNGGTLTPYVFDAPAGSHCTTLDGTIQEGSVIGFRGAYGLNGFFRIRSLHPEGVVFDLKVQPPVG